MTVRETTGIPVRLTAPRAHNAVGHVRRISVTRGWVALCVAALATPALAADKDQDTWKIRILPATKLTLAQAAAPRSAPAPAPQEPGAKPAANTYEPAGENRSTPSGQLRIVPGTPRSAASGGRATYADVYRSIPFSWAEYAANPSYRSQAALGLMLNQMPYPSTSASQVPQYGYVTPYSFDNTYGTPNFANLLYWNSFSW